MDFKFNFGLACALLCIFFINQGSSLMCYQCTTKNPDQEDCLNVTSSDSRFLGNCSAPKDRSCRIQVQWIDFDVLDTTRDKHVIRACASSPFNPDAECFYRTGNLGRMSICNCEGDGCNQASRSEFSSLYAILFVLWIAKFFI